MFDIGFPELLIVSIVALLVLGPERLPEALRTLGLWFGRMRRSFSAVKVEIEREIGMDEVRRQLHNEAILDEMRALESDVGKIGNNLNADIHDDDPDDGRSHADAGEAPPETDIEAETETETDPENRAADSGLKSYADDFAESDIVNEPHPHDQPDASTKPANSAKSAKSAKSE